MEVATFLPRDQNGVADVHNVDVSGVPDTTSSFYPPYGWQVATCSVCGAHVGWHFMHPGTSKPTETCPLDVPYDKDAGKTPKAGKPPPAKPANGAAPLPPRLDARQHLRDSKHVGDLLRKLVGLCQAVSHGYWTYEWCFRKTVSQFHLEPAPKDYKGPKVDLVNVNKVQYIRTPNWSLGKYKVESMLPEDLSFDAPAAGNVYVSHHFIGGQHCDETRNGRHTEVRLHCCVGQARATPQSNANTPVAWQGVAVRGIKETAVCRYLIDVCVPSLCDLPSFKSGGLKDGDQGKKADPAGGAGATKPSGGGGDRAAAGSVLVFRASVEQTRLPRIRCYALGGGRQTRHRDIPVNRFVRSMVRMGGAGDGGVAHEPLRLGSIIDSFRVDLAPSVLAS